MAVNAKKTGKVGAASTGLARVGDPLITEKGQRIDPDGYVNGKKQKDVGPPQTLEASEFRPTKKRAIKELPAEVPLINGIGAVFMYTLLGVGDREIADALKITVVEVEKVRDHPAYKECFDIVVSEFINKNSDLLSARIAAYSHSALETVGNIAMNGKKEETQLRASIDLLDRAGVRPKDNEQRGSNQRGGELRIILVEPGKDTNVQFEFNADSEQES